VANTSTTAGAAAEVAATRKQTKYQHIFIPLVLETLGSINNTCLDIISDLAHDSIRR